MCIRDRLLVAAVNPRGVLTATIRAGNCRGADFIEHPDDDRHPVAILVRTLIEDIHQPFAGSPFCDRVFRTGPYSGTKRGGNEILSYCLAAIGRGRCDKRAVRHHVGLVQLRRLLAQVASIQLASLGWGLAASAYL